MVTYVWVLIRGTGQAVGVRAAGQAVGVACTAVRQVAHVERRRTPKLARIKV